MANIQRIRVILNGAGGLPGVATFYAAAADTTAVAALSTYFSTLKNLFPPGVTLDIQGTGDLIDETNGTIVGVWTQSGGSTQTSTATASVYAAGVGARARWVTGGIVHGRRVVGTTFICPMLAVNFENNGTLSSALLTTLSNAASTLITASDLLIWSRPYVFDPAHPAIPARSGSSHQVVAAVHPDVVTSLRTRRV